jgi:putative membrane protein
MLRLFGILLILILFAAGLSFAVLNAEPVPVNYYFGVREIPLALAMVIPLALGALLGVLVNFGILVRLKQRALRAERQLKLAERETSRLRAPPLHPDA